MKFLSLVILFFYSYNISAQIRISPKSKNQKIETSEIVFEDMTLGSSETNGNKKIDSIKEAFKTFNVEGILTYAIPAMKQDEDKIQHQLDSFSTMFNKSQHIELIESIAATFGNFGYNGVTLFKSNDPTLRQLEINYSYGRENDPKIYRFSLVHNGRIISTYPTRYHNIDMTLLSLKNLLTENTKELIAANEKLIKLANATSEFPYFENNAKTISTAHGNLSWYYILEGEYELAKQNAVKGTVLYPEHIWIKTNEAHAYLLSGNLKKAKEIYSKNKDVIIRNEKFGALCLKDLEHFTIQKIVIPNHDEIKSLLGK